MSRSDAIPTGHDQGRGDGAGAVDETALGSLPVLGTPGRPAVCAVTSWLLGVPLNVPTTKRLSTLFAVSVAEVESMALLVGEFTSKVYPPG